MTAHATSSERYDVYSPALFLVTVLIGLCVLCPGGFSQESNFSLYPDWLSGPAENTGSVALGDIDGDGDLDLVCGNRNNQSNTLYLNDNGIFQTHTTWSSGPANNTLSMALGDVDGDGDLDLVCGNPMQSNTLYLNDNGTIQSYPVWSSEPENYTRSVALGDIDGDGDLDLVCGNNQSNTLYLNDNGIFQTYPTWSSGPINGTISIALGDIDGDGDLDLVCGNNQNNTLYLNDNGAFQTYPTWSSGPVNGTTSVALGDIDGDGDFDLVCGNWGQSNTLYLNENDIFQTSPAWSSEHGCWTHGVALGDIDGDGDLDLVCGNSSCRTFLYLNDNGVFKASYAWSSEQIYETLSVALGDIDGDGDLDLVCGNYGQRNTLYLNIIGAFETMHVWSSGTGQLTYSVTLGDVTGGDALDLVCGNYNLSNTLYRNDDGTFEPTPHWLSEPGNATHSVFLGDVDGDGDLDLACGNVSQSNTLYLNDSGSLDTNPLWLSEPANDTRSVVLGDIDGDGDLDLACGNMNKNNTLYYNVGGTFQASPAWSSGPANATYALFLGDIDRDGDLDLVCGNMGHCNTLYINDGGMFETEPSWISRPANDSRSVVLGDVDGDGDLDLVCGNAARNTLYRNDGGTLQTSPAWSSGPANYTFSVSLEDVDGDGDLDLTCGNYDQSNMLYLNKDGTFETTPAWSSGPANATHSIALGDVDRDGDLDLTFGNRDQGNTLYRGMMAPVFKGDLLSPHNHLPNNGAYLRYVEAEKTNPEYYRISFTAVDVESDPIWVVPEYQYKGNPQWHNAIVDGQKGKIGPFATSTTGVADSIDWDTHLFPFDKREVILRLRVIEIPKRVSIIQHVAPYLKEIGPVIPYRPVISAADVFSFPAVTLGDTTFADLRITNEGTATLTISEVKLPTPDMWLDEHIPIQIAPEGSADLAILLAPSSNADIQGGILIDSDDPFSPSIVVELTAHVRPLEFALANLYPGGEIPQGTALSISIVMEDYVHVDSARVFHREGGETSFEVMQLQRIDDPVNEQYFGLIPASSITARGIEYFVEVYNGRFSQEGSIRRLRTRVKNLEFAATPPAEQYGMISIPLEMEGPILGVLSDDLGGLDITKWRLWGYDYPAETYVALPNDTITHFDGGRGYWLITREVHTIDTGPAEGLSTPTQGTFAIELAPGWNMIGDPFCFPVAWDSVLVDTLTMAEAIGALVEPPIRWEAGNGYHSDVDILRPFEGYWVKNLDTAVVTLRIPPREAPVTESVPATLPAIVAEEEGGWFLEIRAECKGAVDHFNLIGMAAVAENEWDGLDRSEPPLAPGRALSLYFPHTSWVLHRGNYAVDIRGSHERLDGVSLLFSRESSGEDVAGRDDLWGSLWRFDVAKSFSDEAAGDDAMLEFNGIETVPAGAVVYLADRHLQRLIDLRAEDSYRFLLGERGVVSSEDNARFILIVGSEEFAIEHEEEMPKPPAVTALHQNYPNPFNPSTVIRYDIATACEVEILIYDTRGALVKTLFRGSREPGRYEIMWSGENEYGALAASGVYFYRLVAGDFVQTKKTVLLR